MIIIQKKVNNTTDKGPSLPNVPKQPNVNESLASQVGKNADLLKPSSINLQRIL